MIARPSPQGKRRKWLLWTAASLVLLAVLASLAVAVYTGWSLTHPKRKPISATPGALGLTYEEVTFPSRTDHLALKGWYLPAAHPSDRTVILAHGYGDNRNDSGPAPGLIAVAKELVGAGYNTLMFDFRAEGLSEGAAVTVGGMESRDLAGAVDFARQEKGARKVALVGYSMGATTALLVGEQVPEVNAVVEDSAFEALRPYLLENASHWTHLPKFPFTYEILAVVPSLLHESLDEVDPLGGMAKLADRPVLFIHGDADDTIDQHNSKDLYEAYLKAGGKQGKLWIVPGAKHVQARKVQPKEYVDQLLGFLQQPMN